ncbi:MAG TPA: TRAM domain-containing protein, partial [Methylomirabilota bacterium]|nr:TRAM domain-containing protein [Methylomirabilota bacterium]
RKKLEQWIGREVELLIEERNRRGQLAGHTRTHINVVCDGPDEFVGELAIVRVERVTPTTMIGALA